MQDSIWTNSCQDDTVKKDNYNTKSVHTLGKATII